MTKRIVLLQALASTPADIGRLLKGADEAAARKRPVADEWSIAEVLNHLVDVEERYRARLGRVIQEEQPALPAIWPDETAPMPDLSVDEWIARFQAARAETLAFLGELSPADWQRSAVHETFGETRLRFLVQNLINHDAEHLNQLVELRQRLSLGPAAEAQPAISIREYRRSERKHD